MHPIAGLPVLIITLLMTALVPVTLSLSIYRLLRKPRRTPLPLLTSLAGSICYAVMIGTVAIVTFWPLDSDPAATELRVMRVLIGGGWLLALVCLSASLWLSVRGARDGREALPPVPSPE